MLPWGHRPQPRVNNLVNHLFHGLIKTHQFGERTRQQVSDDRTGQELKCEHRVHRAKPPRGHLLAEVADEVRKAATHGAAHPLRGVGIALDHLQHNSKQEAGASGHGGGKGAADLGHHQLGRSIGSPVDDVRDGLPR